MRTISLMNTLIVILLLVLAPLSRASDEIGEIYFPDTQSYQQIFDVMDQARQRAQKGNKLLMYVMGANWCHDSLAFTGKTIDPEFAALIAERYEVQLINVGKFEFIREIVALYDVPVIYGTPTVLIVEPESNQLLNRASLPYWRDASQISMADTLAYFGDYQPGQTLPESAADLPGLASALQQIEAFEQTEAERIYQAYDELGVLIPEDRKAKPTKEFMVKWKNLAKMRSGITADLSQLREQAARQAAAGEPIALEYPTYTLFIDEPASAD